MNNSINSYINAFISSYKLKNAYRTNAIIYSLKRTPLIRKILPYSLYTSTGLKIFANIISIIYGITTTFLFKGAYILLLVYLPISSFLTEYIDLASDSFIHIFFFLTVIGGIMNTYIFEPTVDKYYAIFLLKFDSKLYTLTNYLSLLIKSTIGLLPFTILFGMICNVPLSIRILMPFLVINIKNICNYLTIYFYEKNNKLRNNYKYTPLLVLTSIFLLVVSYVLPFAFQICINSLIFYILFVISFVLSILSFIKLIKYKNYGKMCKELIKRDTFITSSHAIDTKSFQKSIVNDKIKSTTKTGYAYFNYLFVNRHKKLLTRATKIISIIIIAFFAVAIGVTLILPHIDPSSSDGIIKNINEILKNSLTYFLFILFFINRGQRITQTMFINCDRSMLTYRFYRKKESVLSVFKERLKTLICLNIIPGALLALGATILLFTTGGASLIQYVTTFVTIIAMSVFFSIHYLFIYYMLQPYDVNLSVKNPLFMIICSLTYLACYFASQVQIPTVIFGVSMCVFTVVYSFVSLLCVYKFAPKRFKLR